MTTDTTTIERSTTKVEITEPSMYKVVLHNDETTSMEFVISVLENIFHKTNKDAVTIMMAIHNEGKGVAGSPYTKEIAEEKAYETVSYARRFGYPLQATYEALV